MDIEEIRSSGLLELYVLDQLSPAERAEVERHIAAYPELKNDLIEIERSLEIYAETASIKASPQVKDRVLRSIRETPSHTHSTSSGVWPAVAAVMAGGLLVLGYLFYKNNTEAKLLRDEITAVRDTCTATQNELNQQLNILRQLTLPQNTILAFQPTPGFAGTNLYLHTNKDSKRNFIQVKNLPTIADNQSYQLWSIKTDQAPSPLNVFEVPENGLIEVTYVEGTEVYAITIEPEGGRETPTLENLIGTVSVANIQ